MAAVGGGAEVKTVVVEKPTRDVDGLLLSLRKAGSVVSVASDAQKTYVYVDESSDLNPAPLVEAWEDLPELHLESDHAKGHDGIPQAHADGHDVHVVTIQKTNAGRDVLDAHDKLLIETPQRVPVSVKRVRLEGGAATFTVGPSSASGDVFVRVVGAWRSLKAVTIHLRFVTPPPPPPPEPEPPEEPSPLEESAPLAGVTPVLGNEPRGTLFSKLRRLLGF